MACIQLGRDPGYIRDNCYNELDILNTGSQPRDASLIKSETDNSTITSETCAEARAKDSSQGTYLLTANKSRFSSGKGKESPNTDLIFP